MQTLMSFVETLPTETVEPVWPTLDPDHKDAIVMMLARLIAKAAVRNEASVDADKEVRDE